MNTVPLNYVFEVAYGNKLDLCRMPDVSETEAVSFIGRSAANNGVTAIVGRLAEVEPYPAGCITVALGGAILSSFLQLRPFYTAQNVAVLRPKLPMTRDELVFYCRAIQQNRFRYSAFGREANRTLRTLLVPARNAIPAWVANRQSTFLDTLAKDGLAVPDTVPFDTKDWKPFKYTDLFDIVRGQGPSLADAKDNPGPVPYVTASDKNNGVSAWTSLEAKHPGECLSIAIDGSVGEVFFQPIPFCANTAVVALVPKQLISKAGLFFMAALIRREGKLKYGYGRKWGLGRMQSSEVRLPVNEDGMPDWGYMQTVVQALPSHLPLRAVGA